MLNHIYAGTPGVIFDLSPGRTCHGRGGNLAPNDYQPDGTQEGSGAINFAAQPNGLVQVSPKTAWGHLSALRCEVVCIYDGDEMFNDMTLVGSHSFLFWINDGHSPVLTYRNAGGRIDLSSYPFSFPTHQWVTLGFLFNGLGRSSITIDGKEIASFDTRTAAPIAPVENISIGNSPAAVNGWNGRIDDVKIWRYNPHWVDDTFTNRPADPGVRECWKRWSEGLGVALRDDSECAGRVRQLIDDAIASIIRKASSTAVDPTFQAAMDDYRDRWGQGDFHQLQAILADLVAATGNNLQLKNDPALLALANDPCVQSLSSRLPKLECDPGFTGLLENTAKQIEAL